MKLNTPEAAKHTGLSEKTLENWRSLGVGPAFHKLGARVVYDVTELDAWMQSKRCTRTAANVKQSAAK